MYRQDGIIPIVSKERYPKRVLVFDTEAYRNIPLNGLEIQTLRIAVTRFMTLSDDLQVTDDEYCYFTDDLGLMGAIETYIRKDKTLYIYAHNVKYDLQLSGLLRLLLDRKWTIKTFVFDDPPTFIKLSKNRYSIIFIDTFNYWQTALAKMGEQLGISKLSMPEDNANNDVWYVYCKRDVDVLSEYLLSFMRYLKQNDLCGLGITLASQSFRSYTHRFMNHSITIHNRPEALELERDSYSGGRVEAFRLGKYPNQSYYKVDVNSQYPYVMRENIYPYKLIGYSENLPLSQFEKNLNRYYCIAEVLINTPLPVYPSKRLHKLIFPIGTFTTTLHQNELIYAYDNNHIVSINKISVYEQADLFSDYVNFFYELKLKAELEHNSIIRHQAKIMMNSLYGKFGQKNNVSKIVDNQTNTPYGRITGYSETLNCSVEINCLGDNMEVSYKKGESSYSFPAIAGAVTANARMYLWYLMTKANTNHVYYCDTDSLVLDQWGLDNISSLLDSSKLGYLKLENTSNDVTIWGAKDYQFGEDKKHKGVPKSAIEVNEGVWLYEQFRGAKTWLSDGLDTNVHVYTRQKQRVSIYDKGIINQDNTVSPLIFRDNR